ncbi:TetR family transcriptional regulator [Devosia sp. Root685]|nr:TetR family transcriptional regulator [Devosia sp. Root685]
MGRKRVIDQQAILDAGEAVVARLGAANLTLDSVAAEAGISKASVIYDFKTKQALIEAIVERAFRRDREHHAAAEADLTSSDSLAIRGRIKVASEPPPEEFKPVALNLSMALTLDPELRSHMQKSQAETISRILGTASSPRGALLAYLAVEGLKFLEYLDFHHFDPIDRSRIIREIDWLVTATPPDEKPGS